MSPSVQLPPSASHSHSSSQLRMPEAILTISQYVMCHLPSAISYHLHPVEHEETKIYTPPAPLLLACDYVGITSLSSFSLPLRFPPKLTLKPPHPRPPLPILHKHTTSRVPIRLLPITRIRSHARIRPRSLDFRRAPFVTATTTSISVSVSV
jgi:hypothetical protein